MKRPLADKTSLCIQIYQFLKSYWWLLGIKSDQKLLSNERTLREFFFQSIEGEIFFEDDFVRKKTMFGLFGAQI